MSCGFATNARRCPVCDPPGQPGDLTLDGYLIGPDGEELGHCNSCGEEARADRECCEDGEITPWHG